MIGGQKETLHLQALCTLGDCVRRTPRMQSAAQMMPMAQTICNTMRWQTGTLSHHTYSHIRCLESWCFRPSTVQSLGIFWQLANMLCDSTKKNRWNPMEPIQQNISSNEGYCKATWAILCFFMTAWNHFWTSTALSSWPRKCMLHPWAPWHLQARRMASANKAPGQTVLNVQGLCLVSLSILLNGQ